MAEIKSLFDIVTTREIKTFVDKSAIIANKKPHWLERFFPTEDSNTLTVEWLKEKIKISRILSASTFDSDVPLRGYDSIESAKTQMAYFNEGQMVGENDLERLNDLLQLNVNSQSVKNFINQTFKRFTNLINGALDVPEYMRAGLITAAKFNVSQADEYGGSMLYEYDYDKSGAWASEHIIPLTGTDAWSDTTNSDPIKDIAYMDDIASGKGLQIVAMIMGRTTWSQVKNNAKIKDQVTTRYNPLGNVNADIVSQLITDSIGYTIEIIVDNESFVNKSDTQSFYYPQTGQVTFIMRPVLGTTYFGLTPEEIAKNSPDGGDLDVARLEKGIVISTDWKKKPIKKTMICSLITLPTFDYMDAVYNYTWGGSGTSFTLTYNANGGTGTAPSAETKASGQTTTVAAGTGLSKEVGGVTKAFVKWNTASDGSGTDYNAGASFTFNANTTLYAIFES